MKKTFLILACVGALFALALSAFAQDTNPPPGVTVTPDQLATIDKAVTAGLANLPASDQNTVNMVIKWLGAAMILGRVVYGFAKGGFWQAIHGLLTGSNTPNPPGNIPKGATLLKLLLCLALPALVLTGCKTKTQVVNFSKGTGLNLNLPIGYNGANFAEINLKVGQFYTATAVQPYSTNKVYTPAVAFASTTDGSVTAPQIGATNYATIIGGDKFTGSVGEGTGSISNLVGTTSSSGK